MIRRPYTTRAKLFRDSDLEVDIVWYPAKPNAPWLPFPSAVCSLDWDRQEPQLGIYTAGPVGEVPGASRVFNAQKEKPQANGDHICGTPEMFAEGAKFDASVNRTKRADGLPTCCGAMPAGVVVGGKALITAFAGGGLVGGHSYLLHAGTVYGGGDLYDHTTQIPAVPFLSQSGSSVDWLMMLNIIPGETYRFRMWGPTDLTFIRVGSGGTFGGGSWFHDFTDFGAGYWEWTQAIPPGFITLGHWELFKPDLLPRVYTVSVEQL